MYMPIWNAVRAHLSVQRMHAEIAEFFEFSRWSSFDKINSLAKLIVDKMEMAEMDDVRLIEFPADGRTYYGGWVMPLAYDVQTARLQALDGQLRGILADYRLNPTSLMLYSMPTPPEGITAELVVADTPESMTPDRVAGKLVLTNGIGVEFSQAAVRAGAHGLVSDCRNGHRFFKSGREVDVTNEWHNYTISPGADPAKGFGFSISPEKGRLLRSDLENAGRIRVNALIKTRHYEGVLPIISGSLKGALQEEVVLTGHYDEYGADDNCSQIAVALEVCRAIKSMIEAGEVPPLRRTIRVLLPMEVRGFNALVQNRDEIRHICAGLNIDTVGTDQNAATTTCTLSENLAPLPSYAEEFASELLYRTTESNPLFRWRKTTSEMIDNIFGEPLIGAPVPQIWHFSGTHHLETDKPATISSQMLVDMARMAATYTAFLANAGLREAIWLAELTAEGGAQRLNQIVRRSLSLVGNAEREAVVRLQLESTSEVFLQKLGSPVKLVPPISIVPTADITEDKRQQLIGESNLLPREHFDKCVAALRLQMQQSYIDADTRLSQYLDVQPYNDIKADPMPSSASRCVPLKLFTCKGFFGFEDLNRKDLAPSCEMYWRSQPDGARRCGCKTR